MKPVNGARGVLKVLVPDRYIKTVHYEQSNILFHYVYLTYLNWYLIF